LRIIVLLKDIVDLDELRFDPSTRKPLTEGVKHVISELDKRALEAAIRLKEKHGGEVLALSLGGPETKTVMLEALAMGADAAYIVDDENLRGLDAYGTSKVLAAAIEKIGDYSLILCGEMSLDSLSAQVGPRVAELLGLPMISYARELELIDDKRLRAIRDLEDVDEVVEVELPAVVSVVREINEPRIPTLMSIMRAKRKPTTVWDASAIGVDPDALKAERAVEILDVEAPLVERKRKIIEGETVEEKVERLVEALIDEGVLGV